MRNYTASGPVKEQEISQPEKNPLTTITKFVKQCKANNVEKLACSNISADYFHRVAVGKRV